MTASDSSRTRIGERIHRMAMAEGAVLVRFAGGSRFVRRDAATGEWTSDALSDALKAEIRTNRAALAVYADGVFADMDAPPPPYRFFRETPGEPSKRGEVARRK